MTTFGYYGRAALYVGSAVFPIVGAGIETHQPHALTFVLAMAAGCTALHAFIDQSPAIHAQAMKAIEDGA